MSAVLLESVARIYIRRRHNPEARAMARETLRAIRAARSHS
jgi:hypothetical protein